MREIRSSGSAEGVIGNCDPYSDFRLCVQTLSAPFLLNPFEHRVNELATKANLGFAFACPTAIAKTTHMAQIQFWPRAATARVPSGSTLTAIMGFRGFECASCFSSVEVLKSYVDSHDPSDTAARKYWLP